MGEKPATLLVGTVERPHGLSGEVSVSIATNFPERFRPGASLQWRRGAEQRRLTLIAARPHGARMLLTFEGVADREGARALAGGELLVPAAEAFPAPEGSYYEHELLEFACEDASGRPLGRVAGLQATAAGPLLTVALSTGREALVPFVDAIVRVIDREGRRIVLDPPEGLFEL